VILKLYAFGIRLFALIFVFVGYFSVKVKLWNVGRKKAFIQLGTFKKEKRLIWFHCASVGEFEQARPIIEKLKVQGDYQIALTFFSPSGYELRKNYNLADVISYLPLDTSDNAKKFIDRLKPDMVVFIKYDFWFNFMQVLRDRKIKMAVVSAYIPQDHWLLTFPGSLMVNRLNQFSKLFVQDLDSKINLEKVDIRNLEVIGDTRFDRVLDNQVGARSLSFVDEFIDHRKTVVIGSNWPEDDEILFPAIEKFEGVQWIVAPHEMNQKQLTRWKAKFQDDIVFWSGQKDGVSFHSKKVLVIDTIGLLSKVYAYADVAYVGGGFGMAVHNTLEPSVFNIPVIFGPKNQRFLEVQALKKLKIGYQVHLSNEFETTLDLVLNNRELREEVAKQSAEYFASQKGASVKVFNWIQSEFATIGK
jgi:3-deoxy-D-manno-octulosonic-acid transferase